MPGADDLEVTNEPVERTNDELDALADGSAKATNTERPMTQVEASKQAPAREKAAIDQFEFSHNGKPIKGTREQILKWAQMGYDRPQFAQKMNQDKLKWEQEKAQYQQKYGIYQKVDDYANQNKDWWNFVQDQYKSRQSGQPIPHQGYQPADPTTGQPLPDPYAQKFQTLEQRLSQFEKVVPIVQSFEEEKRAAFVKSEDETLAKEVQSIQVQHKDLDWVNLDENGKSLELRVLEHAKQIGTKSFRAAFRDLLHDDLVGKAQSMGKLSVAKGIQQRTKLGVLAQSATPQTMWNQKPSKGIRQTSYEDIAEEIKNDIRNGRV